MPWVFCFCCLKSRFLSVFHSAFVIVYCRYLVYFTGHLIKRLIRNSFRLTNFREDNRFFIAHKPKKQNKKLCQSTIYLRTVVNFDFPIETQKKNEMLSNEHFGAIIRVINSNLQQQQQKRCLCHPISPMHTQSNM